MSAAVVECVRLVLAMMALQCPSTPIPVDMVGAECKQVEGAVNPARPDLGQPTIARQARETAGKACERRRQ